MLKNKYIKFITIVFFVGILVFIFSFFSKEKNSNSIKKEIKKSNNIVLDFDSDLVGFEGYYKKSLIFSERGDQKHSSLNSRKALSLWESIYKNFKDNHIDEYRKTTDWRKELELIYEISIKSNKLIQNKKLNEASIELGKIRVIVRKMRRENGIDNINDQLFDFYEIIIPVTKAKNKKETLPYMKNMKLAFLSLKELNLDKNYNKKINNIEKAISGIDSLIGSDFKNSQNDLLKYFEDLYISVK